MTDPWTLNLNEWIAARPELASLQVVLCDINGCFRGKRIPVADAGKAGRGQMRMPLTVAALDIWGRDVEGSPFLMAGDSDGLCRPTGRMPLMVDWLAHPAALLPLWSFTDTGEPNPLDVRHALAAVAARAERMGLRAVVGTEVEFHFVDPEEARPAPPASPGTGRRVMAEGINAIADIDNFEQVLEDIFRAAEAAGISLASAIAEASPGQFEIALNHHDDVLAAADDAALLKHLIRGTARKHGLAATFMAKPYPEASGNGFHVHISLVDEAGRNVFDDGTDQGSALLRHAVAGCLDAMAPMLLVFAPHLNSYRRITPEAHAPCRAEWDYENRFVSLRVPGGPGVARRIEHRLAGADANPYLVIAAILAAALDGIERKLEPPAPGSDGPSLETSWAEAIAAFRESEVPARAFPQPLVDIFADCKAQELARFRAQMTRLEIDSYLEVV